MMDQQRVQEIRERLSKATPGPWARFTDTWAPTAPLAVHRIGSRDQDIANVYLPRPADAELIAGAPTDLADLLAEREKLLAEVDKLQECLMDAYERWSPDPAITQGFYEHVRAYRAARTGEAGNG